MYRCEMGYEIEKDNTPHERCHSDIKFKITNCKECPHYNKEFDLIDQAIKSARCRIYRLDKYMGNTLTHQVKAKNQQELMRITINALEYYRDNAD